MNKFTVIPTPKKASASENASFGVVLNAPGKLVPVAYFLVQSMAEAFCARLNENRVVDMFDLDDALIKARSLPRSDVWETPGPPLDKLEAKRARVQEIMKLAHAAAKETAHRVGIGSHREEFRWILTRDERDQVMVTWDRMSGDSCFADAVLKWMQT